MVKIGDVVECIFMDDPYCPVPSGTRGVVEHIDDIGQIHVKWDNGSGLALTHVDRYKVVGHKKDNGHPQADRMISNIRAMNKVNENMKKIFKHSVIKETYIGDIRAYSANVVVFVIECDDLKVEINDEEQHLFVDGKFLLELCCPSKYDNWSLQMSTVDGEVIGYITDVLI